MPKIDEFIDQLKKLNYFNELELKLLSIALKKFHEEKKKVFTANEIAKFSGISVTNAYKYLYMLQEKGFIESSRGESRNKTFWLTQSNNPIPRLLSILTKEFNEKKKICNNVERAWEWFVPRDKVWNNQKFYEKYEAEYEKRASFIIDAARKEIIITADRFFDDFIILDAIKRAVGRNIIIRAIVEQLHPDQTESLRKIGIQLRLGKVWPYVIIADGSHGITYDPVSKSGIWFFNQQTKYTEKFEEQWENSQEI